LKKSILWCTVRKTSNYNEQSSLAAPVTNTWPTHISPLSYNIKATGLACISKIFFPIGVVISLDSFYCSIDICYSKLFCTFITFMTCHSAFCNLSYENFYWHLFSFRVFFLWNATKSNILQNFIKICGFFFPRRRELFFLNTGEILKINSIIIKTMYIILFVTSTYV